MTPAASRRNVAPHRVERALRTVASVPTDLDDLVALENVVQRCLRRINNIRRDLDVQCRMFCDTDRRIYIVHEDDVRFDRMRVTVPHWFVGNYWRPSPDELRADLLARMAELP